MKSYFTACDFITVKVLTTKITTFNLVNFSCSSVVDVMTLSINPDADSSIKIVLQLPDVVNMFIVRYVNMNGRQSNINLSTQPAQHGLSVV